MNAWLYWKAAEFQEMLGFQPAPKLDVVGELDPGRATPAELRIMGLHAAAERRQMRRGMESLAASAERTTERTAAEHE